MPFSESENEFFIRLISQNLNLKVKNKMMSCPFHVDRTPSMSFDCTKGVAHCFSCGWSGTINQLLKQTLGVSGGKVLGKKVDHSYFSFDRFTEGKSLVKKEASKKLEALDFVIEGEMYPLNDKCFQYLENRGIDPEVALNFDCRYMPCGKINGLEFQERMLIPIFENKKLVSYEGRDITGKSLKKVLYPPGSFLKTIYDIDNLNPKETLYVVEGLMDLMALRQIDGLKNSTALFGCSFNERKASLLKKFSHIVFVPDNDPPGYKSVFDYSKHLEDSSYLEVLPVPSPYKDVGDLAKSFDLMTYGKSWVRKTMPFSQWRSKVSSI